MKNELRSQVFSRRNFPLLLIVAAMVAAPTASGQRYRADLKRFVVVGDSISAGFQNNNFASAGQLESFPKVIATQAGVAMDLPLIAGAGFPADPTATRALPIVQATNLAVPGHQMYDALEARPGRPMKPRDYYPVAALEYLTYLVLGIPGKDGTKPVSRSQVEWAADLNPTTLSVWIGNNDVVAALLTGDPASMTPTPQFTLYFTQLMTKLALTRATILVANIPEVTDLPFVMHPRLAYVLAAGMNPATDLPLVPQDQLVAMGIGDPNTRVTGLAVQVISNMLQSHVLAPLPPNFVLTGSEINAIRTRVREFNAVIASGAFVFNLINREKVALVDIYSLMKSISPAVLPGLFSGDGVHPNKAGHIVLANEFIRVLNTRFGTAIPPAVQ